MVMAGFLAAGGLVRTDLFVLPRHGMSMDKNSAYQVLKIATIGVTQECILDGPDLRMGACVITLFYVFVLR